MCAYRGHLILATDLWIFFSAPFVEHTLRSHDIDDECNFSVFYESTDWVIRKSESNKNSRGTWRTGPEVLP